MADEFCLKMPNFHVTFRDLLHAVNLQNGTDGFTSPPKEGVLRNFFRPEKSDVFGRVWTRELGYQRPARYFYTTEVANRELTLRYMHITLIVVQYLGSETKSSSVIQWASWGNIFCFNFDQSWRGVMNCTDAIRRTRYNHRSRKRMQLSCTLRVGFLISKTVGGETYRSCKKHEPLIKALSSFHWAPVSRSFFRYTSSLESNSCKALATRNTK